jgi:hypothetical protein
MYPTWIHVKCVVLMLVVFNIPASLLGCDPVWFDVLEEQQ